MNIVEINNFIVKEWHILANQYIGEKSKKKIRCQKIFGYHSAKSRQYPYPGAPQWDVLFLDITWKSLMSCEKCDYGSLSCIIYSWKHIYYRGHSLSEISQWSWETETIVQKRYDSNTFSGMSCHWWLLFFYSIYTTFSKRESLRTIYTTVSNNSYIIFFI